MATAWLDLHDEDSLLGMYRDSLKERLRDDCLEVDKHKSFEAATFALTFSCILKDERMGPIKW